MNSFQKKIGKFTFLLEIRQSKKNRLYLTFHYQENNSKIGILRIDYNNVHKNPEQINEFVPEKFKPYVGRSLQCSHIHYYVQGYKSLAWAIPLTEDEFMIKDIPDDINFHTIFADIIKLFAKTINITTKIEVNSIIF